MLLDLVTSTLLSTTVMFVLGFALLFLIYYYTSPFYTEYGDRRSRLYYSLINSFYFSFVLAVLFAVLPSLSETYGLIASLLVGMAIVLVATITQIYVITTLAKRGVLKIRRKKRGTK